SVARHAAKPCRHDLGDTGFASCHLLDQFVGRTNSGELGALGRPLSSKGEGGRVISLKTWMVLTHSGVQPSDVWSCFVGTDRARFYYFFMIVVVIRYKPKATARRALTFIVRIFVNDTIAIAIWTGFHVSVPRSRTQLDEAAHIINPTLCKPATRSSKGQHGTQQLWPEA